VLLEAGGVLTDPSGNDLFPLRSEAMEGTPLAFLGGDPIAHHEGLSDITRP
jgi:hypothetical protein